MDYMQTKQRLTCQLYNYQELPQILQWLEERGLYQSIIKLYCDILENFEQKENLQKSKERFRVSAFKEQLKLISEMALDQVFEERFESQNNNDMQKQENPSKFSQNRPLDVVIDLCNQENQDLISYQESKSPTNNSTNSSLRKKNKALMQNNKKKYRFSKPEIMNQLIRKNSYKSFDLSPKNQSSFVSRSVVSQASSPHNIQQISTFGQQLIGATSFTKAERLGIPLNKISPGPQQYDSSKGLDYLKKSQPSARIGNTPKKEIWNIQDTPGPSSYYPSMKYRSK